ncbi:S9 family peptidase [Longimicrobium sp.]|uniref:S9 family peptidase n=1 Tax=Longimicrobium sp. TaxID=2029185 RepID=UPI002E30D5D2|nr:DPP IV N-terminal domain-containing protein [Longimicrobium sp.]HEX6040367.1 DPP IV N-terminal domain-containing protein [Longimicrobium sp.]
MDARLERAETYHEALRTLAGGRVRPVWVPGEEAFVYRAEAGPNAGQWLRVDALRGTSAPVAPEQRPPQPTPPGLNRIARDGATLRILRSDGGDAARLTDGRDTTWQVVPGGWHPGGRWFAAIRSVSDGVHTVPVIDYSTPMERVEPVEYPKSGTPLPVMTVQVVDADSGGLRAADLDTRDAYVWVAGWRAEPAELLVIRMTRTGKEMALFAVDPRTGRSRPLARDARPETSVAALDFATGGWVNQVTVLPDGSGFLWFSERDGWRHLYRHGWDGGAPRQLTSGAFPVHRVARVDPASGRMYVIASADAARPYDQHLYAIDRNGGALRALTREPGMHDIQFSPSGRTFLDVHSSIDRPYATDLRRADGTTVARLETADTARLAALGHRPPEPFRAMAADGTTEIHGVIYTPTDFDPARRYPVVDYIYAGPFLSAVQKEYAPTISMQRIAASLAQMGLVVVMVDGRGTPGRSKAFQDATYGRVGQMEIADHVAALRGAAGTRPWMDLSRAGIAGHSWGGYFALRGMLTAPEFFRAGYAGAPGDVTELAVINEPHMGLPSENPAGYAAASNPALAANLAGPLKIMHGTSDVNAPFSTTMRMINALIAADKRFELLVIPGAPHNPPDPVGRYYRQDLRRFMAGQMLGLQGIGNRE